MKRFHLLAMAALCMAGCTATYPTYHEDRSRAWDQPDDGSSSPVTAEQAREIAKAIVTKRERWPDAQPGSNRLMHSVHYEARRLNDGAWVVIAHRGEYSTNPQETSDFLYDAVPAAIVVIDKTGKVSSYSRQWSSD